VTLTKSGSAPIVLEAMLNPGPKGNPFVSLSTKNGVSVLKEIDLNGFILVFEETEGVVQKHVQLPRIRLAGIKKRFSPFVVLECAKWVCCDQPDCRSSSVG